MVLLKDGDTTVGNWTSCPVLTTQLLANTTTKELVTVNHTVSGYKYIRIDQRYPDLTHSVAPSALYTALTVYAHIYM